MMQFTTLSFPIQKQRKPICAFLTALCALLGLCSTAGTGMAETAHRATAAMPVTMQRWDAVLSNHGTSPVLLIAVDKQDQKVFAYERRSPLRLIAEFPCTTGQVEGDKLTNGDLKTPEGVYFVEKHITTGLNYTLYGKEAYPLNYPNPVDRLNRKSGYGIWLHGKGVPLAPQDTKGCVGMNNEDIAVLGQKIRLGQPVTIAARIEHKADLSGERATDISGLEQQVYAWAKAWGDRSPKMFDFYNADAYSRAQNQSFNSFRAQKEHIFKSISWIDNKINDLQILEGPGYWVTWFNQQYTAPNLKTSGTRRLYWQKDAEGRFRIIGMEWLPGLISPVLLASADADADTYTDAGLIQNKPSVDLPGKLQDLPPQNLPSAAEPDQTGQIQNFLSGWKAAWEKADIGSYAGFYAKNSMQSGRTLKQLLQVKRKLWEQAKPQEILFDSINITKSARGFKVEFLQTYTDTKGYSDQGNKTLLLEIIGGVLLITREDWKPVAK
jgi:murein L,D-transpeptidase YafK